MGTLQVDGFFGSQPSSVITPILRQFKDWRASNDMEFLGDYYYYYYIYYIIIIPSTNMNYAKTFIHQLDWPFFDPPYTVQRGFCPGTTVNITQNCKRRGYGRKSKDTNGHIIPKWCCRSCSETGIHLIDFKGNCLMPSETTVEEKAIPEEKIVEETENMDEAIKVEELHIEPLRDFRPSPS
jgi:hypothetical protein